MFDKIITYYNLLIIINKHDYELWIIKKWKNLEKLSILLYFAAYAHLRTTYALFMIPKNCMGIYLYNGHKTGSVGGA